MKFARQKGLSREQVRADSERLFGVSEVRDGHVRYSLQGEQIWSVGAEELRLVGEYTTDSGLTGPWAGDYFFVLVAGLPLRQFEAPMYANPELLAQLGAELGTTLLPGLNNRTEFASRVVWPADLAEEELFQLTPEPRRGASGWLLDKLSPRFSSAFAPAVEAYLGSHP